MNLWSPKGLLKKEKYAEKCTQLFQGVPSGTQKGELAITTTGQKLYINSDPFEYCDGAVFGRAGFCVQLGAQDIHFVSAMRMA